MSKIIGIGGVSTSGKTTLATRMALRYRESGYRVLVIHQDDYVKDVEQIPKIRGKTDWEVPESINFHGLRQKIYHSSKEVDITIAEGLMIFYDEWITRLFDHQIFISISRATFNLRKAKDIRWSDQPDEPWYIEHIWHSWEKYGKPSQTLDYIEVSGEKKVDLERLFIRLVS